MILGGRYELVRLVGRGGMGEVHEALDRQTQRRVAIKRVRMVDTTPEVLARFAREMKAMAQITSRHVVAIYDAGTDDATGEPYMVMDYLEGQDLGAFAKRVGTVPVELALRLVAQACEGLVAAHAVGIIHRDIKPGNLFLTSRNVVKLLDFGIARMGVAGDATELTRTGAMIGSPAYMAPEQLRGARAVDPRADVWALGVVAYRLLCGSVPHAAVDSLADLMFAICSEPAPPIRTRAPWLPAGVAALVHRALEIDRERRPPSARAFADELARHLPDGHDISDAALAAWLAEPPLEATALDQRRSGSVEIASSEPRAAAAPVAPPVTAPARAVAVATLPPASEPRIRVSFVLAAVLMVGGVAAAAVTIARRWHREDTDLVEPSSPQAQLQALLPAELYDTEGARWYIKVSTRCTGLEVDGVLRELPPPADPTGAAFAAACAAVAGKLDRARAYVTSLPPDERARGVWPMFELVHPLADRRSTDTGVADVMRLVLEFWPDNYQALYHAGVTEYLVGDRRAAGHLESFLDQYQGNDGFRATAQALFGELQHPSHDCTRTLAQDPEGNQFRPLGCGNGR